MDKALIPSDGRNRQWRRPADHYLLRAPLGGTYPDRGSTARPPPTCGGGRAR